MAEVPARTQIRIPLILGFSLLLLAISSIGLFAYWEISAVNEALGSTREKSNNLFLLQRQQQELYRAESSVHAFAISHDVSTLQNFYIFTKLYHRQKADLLERAGPDTLQQSMRELIQLFDKKENNLQRIVELASKDQELDGFFSRLDALIAGDSSALSNYPTDSAAAKTILEKFVDSSQQNYFPMSIPVVSVDSLGDSITIAKEAFFALKGYQLDYQAELEQLIKAGQVLSRKIRIQITKAEKGFKTRSDKSIYEARNRLQTAEQVFTLFSISAVIMGLLFLAYLINSLDRNRRLQEELRDQKAKAERLGQAKEDFLANMSHEIRTPMNAVIGFSEQLGNTSLSSLQQRLLTPLRNSAHYLLALINDILDISKLESGQFQLEQKAFRPQDLAQDLETIFRQQAQERGLALSVDVAPTVPAALLGDPLRLKQMLYNLVSNALKFTEKGQVSVHWEVEKPETSELVHVTISVADTGIGISPERQEDVFSKFSQAERTTARRYGGTGLGLAITKRLAELMGGDIGLESEVGRGTTVSLRLPLPLAEDSDLAPAEAQLLLDPAPLRGKHVLLVDDEMYNRELALFILRKWSVEVHTAENGLQAVEQVKSGPSPDLILMDLHMPKMGGIEATRVIRDELKRDLPILAMTATATPIKIQEAHEAGMNGHLLKPFQEADLLQTLLRLLDLPSVSKVTESTPAPSPEAPMETPSDYSLEAMYRLAHEDERFVKRMLTLFVERSGAALDTLARAAKDGDWPQVGMSAHKLVPPCRHLGLQDLVDRLKQIELDCEAGQAIDLSRIEAVIRDIQAVAKQAEEDAAKLDAAS